MSNWRKGGISELGDADISDSGIMATSGHKTLQMISVYTDKTDQQRGNAWCTARNCLLRRGTNREPCQNGIRELVRMKTRPLIKIRI